MESGSGETGESAPGRLGLRVEPQDSFTQKNDIAGGEM